MRQHTIPYVRLRVNLPCDLAARIEFFLADPLRPGKKKYGSFSKMTEMLWMRYFAELERDPRERPLPAPEMKEVV